jgi:hypothetical protein
VEVHLIERNIVDGGLCLAQEFEGPERKCARIGWQRRLVQDFADHRQGTAVLVRRTRRVFVVMRVFVIMMMVIVIMIARMIVRRVGVVAIHQHARFSRADAASVYGIKDECCAEAEGRGGLLEERGRDASVDQGAEEHVSTEPGEAFEIANAHG